MYELYTCVLSITLTLAVAIIADRNDGLRGPCVMPAFPAHGTYASSPAASPGDHLEAAQLNVTCDPGYHLVGDDVVSCLSSWWSSDMPECLPFCKPGKKSGVINCETGVTQCVITAYNLPSLGSRTVSSEYNCGDVGPISDRIIAGGSRAEFDNAPWHAGVYTKSTRPYMQICGGTLVARDVVITAAHCFSQDGSTPYASDYAVAVGKIYRPWDNDHDYGAQQADIKEIRIPPRYLGSQGNFQEDIAIALVAREFDYSDTVKPACVSFDRRFDQQQLQEGNFGKVFGWGLTGENARSSQVLQIATLPYVDIHRCIRDSPPWFKSSITGDKFCAGYSNGTAVCRGDSGGGLLFPKYVGGKERYFLRGVVSTSPSSEHACNIHTWATFTHILKHEGFLASVVGISEAAAPVDVAQPASSFGEYPVYQLDYRIATRKPQSGWV